MTYGRKPTDAAYQRRQFIHEHIVSQRLVPHALPTNVRAVYYVGKSAGAWPGDGGPGRQSSQYVSDACQWLINAGLVGEHEIVDASGYIGSSLGVVNLLDYLTDQAKYVALDPWAPKSVPVLIAEGRNDLALIEPIGEDRLIRWAPLGGMGSSGHLRRLANQIAADAPIGYVGDANRSGEDIEFNAENFLRSRGWDGEWTRLLVTEDQIVDHTLPVMATKDGRDGKVSRSVESAAMPTGAARAVINDWLDSLLPATPTADDSHRAAIVAALEALR